MIWPFKIKGFINFSKIDHFRKSRQSCITKCKSFILMTFWGVTESPQTKQTLEELNMAAKKKAKKVAKKKTAKKKKKK